MLKLPRKVLFLKYSALEHKLNHQQGESYSSLLAFPQGQTVTPNGTTLFNETLYTMNFSYFKVYSLGRFFFFQIYIRIIWAFGLIKEVKLKGNFKTLILYLHKNKNTACSWEKWYTLLIPALWRGRVQYLSSKASLVYRVNSRIARAITQATLSRKKKSVCISTFVNIWSLHST